MVDPLHVGWRDRLARRLETIRYNADSGGAVLNSFYGDTYPCAPCAVDEPQLGAAATAPTAAPERQAGHGPRGGRHARSCAGHRSSDGSRDLARKGHEPFGPAGVAPEPGKSSSQEGAAQERTELGVDESRQPLAVAQGCGLDAKGLDVLAHVGREHRRGQGRGVYAAAGNREYGAREVPRSNLWPIRSLLAEWQELRAIDAQRMRNWRAANSTGTAIAKCPTSPRAGGVQDGAAAERSEGILDAAEHGVRVGVDGGFVARPDPTCGHRTSKGGATP